MNEAIALNSTDITTNNNLDRPTNEVEAKLAAQEHYKSEVENGEVLLARLPENPTYADLREVIWADHQRLMESSDQ